MYITILIAGFGGGVIRGLVGFIKHQRTYSQLPEKLYLKLLLKSKATS